MDSKIRHRRAAMERIAFTSPELFVVGRVDKYWRAVRGVLCTTTWRAKRNASLRVESLDKGSLSHVNSKSLQKIRNFAVFVQGEMRWSRNAFVRRRWWVP